MREETIIEKYNELQKKILSDFAVRRNTEKTKRTFRTAVKDLYGFEKEFGWNILLNAFYIIDDCELAKKSFTEFDFQGPSRHQDVGERYLRLYGVLNAVYQQKLALENLLELHKISTKKEVIKTLKTFRILELRNKIGAHSANFLTNEKDAEHKFDVFEISRPDLQLGKVVLIKNQKDFEKFDFVQELDAFNSFYEDQLKLIIEKIIKKLFNNQGKIYEQYQLIERLKNGAILFGDTVIDFPK